MCTLLCPALGGSWGRPWQQQPLPHPLFHGLPLAWPPLEPGQREELFLTFTSYTVHFLHCFWAVAEPASSQRRNFHDKWNFTALKLNKIVLIWSRVCLRTQFSHQYFHFRTWTDHWKNVGNVRNFRFEHSHFLNYFPKIQNASQPFQWFVPFW